ncbi:SDR family NAD(P)-dependent oxidoreductase [Variovorax sp. GT1P44]|uniref:SDR family NAD(P)-dependent oxidoreductase n=1 Tax=Variovorax sp. GT1P44 TaxID=3443742 RepID=UPI003F471D37
MFNLTGKVALVTGGNGGIGLGMAKGLAQAGARVVVAARNPQKSAAAVAALKALGSDSFALAADVTDERAVTALFDELAARCGRLDILVNNAGTTVRKPVDQLTLAEWHQVMDTNLTSAFLCCRAAHPHLKAAGGGKIINIGSMMSIFGAPYSPAYGASKGGIVQLTRSMATSWAADGIQVNAVLPGWIQTELTDGARAQVPGLNERVVARTAAGRWGQPEDLAGIAVFLASAASDFVTGTAIPVDGGYSIAG